MLIVYHLTVLAFDKHAAKARHASRTDRLDMAVFHRQNAEVEV